MPEQYALVMTAALTHPVDAAPPLASFRGFRSLSSTLNFVAGDFFLIGIFFMGCGLKSWQRVKPIAIYLLLEGKMCSLRVFFDGCAKLKGRTLPP